MTNIVLHTPTNNYICDTYYTVEDPCFRSCTFLGATAHLYKVRNICNTVRSHKKCITEAALASCAWQSLWRSATALRSHHVDHVADPVTTNTVARRTRESPADEDDDDERNEGNEYK